MDKRVTDQLPLLEEFNAVAEDEELFSAVFDGESDDLPTDKLFIVSHGMSRSTPMHERDFFELVYVMSGRVKNVVGDSELFLLPDSLCLMLPGSPHALLTVDPDAIVVVLCLRPELFQEGVFHEFLQEETPLSRTMRDQEKHRHMVFSDAYGRILRRSMVTLLKEYHHAHRKPNYAVVARTLLLLAQLSEIETYSFYGVDGEMMEMLTYISEHPAEVSVASLARRFGYNETYFSHMVRKKVGLRVRELIVAARLRCARELLAEGELSVQAVADAVGYTSYSHFNRIFRQTFAITPAAYRAYVTGELAGM